jgi:hypothetical protein
MTSTARRAGSMISAYQLARPQPGHKVTDPAPRFRPREACSIVSINSPNTSDRR